MSRLAANLLQRRTLLRSPAADAVEKQNVLEVALRVAGKVGDALEAMVLQTEKLLSENGDKLPEAERGEVQSAIEDAKAAIESGDADRISDAREKLTAASHKMAQANRAFAHFRW